MKIAAKTFVAALLALAVPSAAFSATKAVQAKMSSVKILPLKDGMYTTNPCDGSALVHKTIIALGTLTEGSAVGHQTLSPLSEGQYGVCIVKKIKSSGKIYSGTTRCAAGAGDVYSGIYKFRYEILDDSTFSSRGKIYRWCGTHF